VVNEGPGDPFGRPIDSLPADHRTSLERWGVDASTAFGVLVAPPHSGLTPKVVDAAAAELFAGLKRPGRSPAIPVDRLAGLVLDGVLEIEGPTGFVGGPLAYDVLAHQHGAPKTSGDRLGRLARAALEYAERLCLTSSEALTARLYGYHRVPASRRWARSYPGPAAVLDLLSGPVVSRHWVPRSNGGQSHWLSWSRRDGGAGEAADGFPYKLYVSPRIDEVPDALPRLVDTLTATSAPRFKVGADAAGLLRPDKIVIYLRDAQETSTVAAALDKALAGVSPHGVPFSAYLAGDGLLSWGGDPPRDAAPIGRRPESWRLSVCRRLAESLVAAQRVSLTRVRPVDFALERLAVDGVDVRWFAPAGLPTPTVPA
jgi:hypothetical protein